MKTKFKAIRGRDITWPPPGYDVLKRELERRLRKARRLGIIDRGSAAYIRRWADIEPGDFLAARDEGGCCGALTIRFACQDGSTMLLGRDGLLTMDEEPAREDRLTALALLYSAAVDWLCADFDENGKPWGRPFDDDLSDQVTLAEGALLALLPPVQAPPCEVHDTMWRGCPDCIAAQNAVKTKVIGAAFARLGLRAPWSSHRRRHQ
jgi:hypothetical protein